MIGLVVRSPYCGDIRVVMFPEFADNSHFYICYSRVIVPCLSGFLYQFFHSFLKSRVAIAPNNRGVKIVFIVRLSRNVAWPMPTVQVVRVVCMSVLGISSVPRFHPYDIDTWDNLDIDIFYSLPPVVTVSYNLVDTVAFIVLQHIPLHIFFNDRAVRIRIFVSYLVIARAEEFA